jgi:hypothetical protein
MRLNAFFRKMKHGSHFERTLGYTIGSLNNP